MTIHPPTKATLKKYGLSKAEWLKIAKTQGGVCGVCKRLPITGRLCIDHEHAVGWRKMKPDKRKTYVRGLLCIMCNRFYCGKGITIAKAEGVSWYLRRYEEWTRFGMHPVQDKL